MDAAVFPARAHAEPAIAALHGPTAASLDDAATTPGECNAGNAARRHQWEALHGARWIAGTDERAGLCRPQRYVCPADRGVANGSAGKPRSRAQHRLHHDASRIAPAEFADCLAGAERD